MITRASPIGKEDVGFLNAFRVGAPLAVRLATMLAFSPAVTLTVVARMGLDLVEALCGRMAIEYEPGASALAGRGSGTPVPRVAALASLHHLDAPTQAAGAVTVRALGETREMLITTKRLPKLLPDQFYEVWLLQPATNKMLPVGVLPPSGSGSFELAAVVMSQFSAIDVSLQANNGDPAHSSRSVLRGLVEAVTT
jgi:hypothetical protein